MEVVIIKVFILLHAEQAEEVGEEGLVPVSRGRQRRGSRCLCGGGGGGPAVSGAAEVLPGASGMTEAGILCVILRKYAVIAA